MPVLTRGHPCFVGFRFSSLGSCCIVVRWQSEKERRKNDMNSMLKYILKRIVLMIFTAFFIMTMLFIFVKLLPDPISCAPGSTACQSEAIWRENLGYNKPVLVQY